MNGWRTSGPIISIIIDNKNNHNNKNNDNNNSNNNYNNYNDNDNDNDSNNKILIFSSGGGGNGSHQLRPSGFKIFEGKYNSFYADDLENMRYSVHNSESPLCWELCEFELTCYPYYRVNCP